MTEARNSDGFVSREGGIFDMHRNNVAASASKQPFPADRANFQCRDDKMENNAMNKIIINETLFYGFLPS